MSKASAAFESVLAREWRSGRHAPIDVVQKVQALATPTDVRAGLDALCRKFDPAKPPARRETFELARTTAFNLFMRALELASPDNDLLELVQAMPTLTSDAPDAALKSRPKIYAKRYRRLSPEDRAKIEGKAGTLAKARKATRDQYLLATLEDAFRAQFGRVHGDIEELWRFAADAPAARKAFAAIAAPCESAWTAGNRSPKPAPTPTLKALNTALDAWDKWLEAAIAKPMDFWRLLAWLREARLDRKLAWANVWEELYLDVVARAQVLAASRWNLASLVHARTFTGVDAAFIFGPFNERGRALMTRRLRPHAGNVADFKTAHRSRRCAHVAGKLLVMDLLDELRTLELAARMKEDWETDARAVAQRKITVPSQKEVLRGTFHVGDTAQECFTVVWIPPGRVHFLYLELHGMPGFLFEAAITHARLADMLEDKAYLDLARNAAALTVFMLAYLQIIGYALDVATAGASGGLRFIVLRFAEERLKEQALTLGFKLAGIDNPWVQTFAGLGVGLVPSAFKAPRAGIKVPHDLDAPPPSPRGTDPPPPSAPANAERAIDARLGTPDAPRLRLVPDEATPEFKPRLDADPLTEAERAAVRRDAVLLDEWKKQEERMILRVDVVANDNALQVQRQQVVTLSRDATRPPTGTVTGPTHAGYVTRRPAGSPSSGGTRTPYGKPLGDEPEPLVYVDVDIARRRGVHDVFAGRQSAANEGQLAAELIDDARLGIRPTPGGQGMGVDVDAGNLMHYARRNGLTYAEALQAHPVANPQIPARFAKHVQQGRVICLRDLPPDLRAEFWLGATARADRVQLAGGVVFELKPNSVAGIRKGLRQVAEYATLMTKIEKRQWQGIVVVYDAAEARKLVSH